MAILEKWKGNNVILVENCFGNPGAFSINFPQSTVTITTTWNFLIHLILYRKKNYVAINKKTLEKSFF